MNQLLPTGICGYNIPHEIIKIIAEKLAISPVEINNTKDIDTSNMVVLFNSLTNEDLPKLEALEMSRFVDINVKDLAKAVTDTAQEGAFKISISTKVAYNLNLDSFLTEKIAAFVSAEKEYKEDIKAIIHEALNNALLHGNLEIPNELVNSAEKIDELEETVKQRLSIPDYAFKELEIIVVPCKNEIKLSITDDRPQNNDSAKQLGTDLKKFIKDADGISVEQNRNNTTLIFSPLSTNEPAPLVDETGETIVDHTSDEKDSLLLSAKVLLIEDDIKTQALIGRLLKVLGVTKLFFATTGEEGIQKASAINPDMIILNVNLPTIQGDVVLEHLKSSPTLKDIPVVVETSYSKQEIKDMMFKKGATDYLIKPFSIMEFFTRVKLILKNKLVIKNLENELKKIVKDLLNAKSIQSWLLPKQRNIDKIKETYKLNINNLFLPSAKLSGDFWGTQVLAPNKVSVFCCSFSDQGLTAILNTFRLSSLLRENHIMYPFNISSYLENINNVLLTILSQEQNVSFLYGIFDTAAENFTYAMAGAPAPIFINKGSITANEGNDPPLATIKDAKYKEYKVPFKKGDTVIIYSKTLIKSPTNDSPELGFNGFKKIISRYHGAKIFAEPNEAFDNITCDLLQNIPTNNISNDLTLLHITKE